MERLRPQLRSFRDERGRELVDVPDAPLPDPDTPAPVRFLPVFDNAILAHGDRSRILADGYPPRIADYPTVLVDGFACGMWQIANGQLEIRLFADVTAGDRAAARGGGRATAGVRLGHRAARRPLRPRRRLGDRAGAPHLTGVRPASS